MSTQKQDSSVTSTLSFSFYISALKLYIKQRDVMFVITSKLFQTLDHK